MSSPQPLSLKEWTSGVVDSLKSRGGGGNRDQSLDKIVCSPQYLTCALKIAHSLACQMATVEEERGYKRRCSSSFSSSSSSHRHDYNASPPLEAFEKSWTDYVSVYCATKATEEKKVDSSGSTANDNNTGDDWLSSIEPDFEPLPYNGDNFGTDDFHTLAHQLSTLFQPVDFLDIRGAILNEEAVTERPLSTNGKLEIKSLGVTFQELFSGGRVTVEAVTSQQQQQQVPTNVGGGPINNYGVHHALFNLDENDGSLGILNMDGKSSKKRAQHFNHIDHFPHKMMVRSSSVSTSTSTSSSMEQLKLLGLPISLCNLISNMIDNSDGDFPGGGVYEFVSEVRDDLKLMIDSPTVYLHDFDLGEAARSGLQFGNSMFGREAELQTLKESFQRAISNEFEVAMISGTSGIGKSELSREFARFTDRDGCIFLSGRFDKLQSQPLHAISSAFDNYCASLSAKDRLTATKVSSALKENVGEEMSCLVTAMPSLANILGESVDSREIEPSVDAQKRLRYLFCQFVQIICQCQDKPVILFLDDCQWIDAASAGLLIQLMMSVTSQKYHRFFFFMSCRDDEMSETHPLNLVLSSISSFGINLTKIDVTSLSKDALNKMVSTTLSLLPRITRPLAEILHHKTKGGPLFVKQLMMELYKQRLLYPSLSRRRWDWDADKISDMKIPDSVATFISKSFDRLPPEVLSALIVLSCFGASAEVSLIEVLQREINQPLVDPLEAAVAESVLRKKNGRFYFMHDKLQEAAYSMMGSTERCLHHNLYGQALGFVVMRENDDRYLLTAATQINFGGPGAVIDNNQAMVVAKLNLDAGKKAMSMSDFFAADTFFNHGISFLRNGHWNEQYDVSLELFNLSASCALMNADHERVKMLTGEISLHARGIEDHFRAICMTITLLLWSSKLPEAMEQIHTTLSRLGEELPLVTADHVIHYQTNETKTLLSGLSDETLLNYRPMTIPSKIMAMELFSKQFINYTFSGNGDSMPIIPLKMVQISLLHGMSSLSGVGFALYGNYLAIARGEVEEGYRYVKLALALSKRYPSVAHDSEIMYYSAHTKLRVEPIQSSIEHYSETHKVAMASGAARFAFGCSFIYDICSFWSGKKLDLIISSMNVTTKQMIFYKNFVMLALLQPYYRTATRLTGQSAENCCDHVTNIFGEAYNEDDVSCKLPMVMLANYLLQFYEGLLFHDLNKTTVAVQKYISIAKLTACNMSNPSEFFRIFYAGLASLWVGRELDDKVMMQRGIECKNEIEKLAISASVWNFQNKSYLLQAETQFCERNFDAAEALYDAAIFSSQKHKFVNEEALANELAGRFYLETGRSSNAVNYFLRAAEKYTEWGANEKAASLTKYFDKQG